MTTTATIARTDQEIQTDVLAELRWDHSVQANEIGVAVKNGVVTLTGTVDTYLKKWKAEEAAHRVAGVTAVANDITVRTIGERTDADIAAAAVHALKWNASVPAEKIQVTVDKGWVTLKGEVEWQYQRGEAERAVRPLWGAKGVSNLIVVKPHASPTDLKKKIEDALVRSASIDANNITVEVQGSKAILKGKVRSWAEKQEAERTAWLAPGITSVDSQIKVSFF
ncbi:MAG: Transport-associated protein [Edaphobacter sp.]|nr:Transport-associated protein [Edaphobacter sp.]